MAFKTKEQITIVQLQMPIMSFIRSKAEMALQGKPHVHDLDRQRATPSYDEYLKWRAITGSGEELSCFTEYCRRSKSKTGLYVKLYTYGLDRQWAIATSTIKSNYFRFATMTLNLTHNELSNIFLIYELHDYHVLEL